MQNKCDEDESHVTRTTQKENHMCHNVILDVDNTCQMLDYL